MFFLGPYQSGEVNTFIIGPDESAFSYLSLDVFLRYTSYFLIIFSCFLFFGEINIGGKMTKLLPGNQ